MDPDGPASARQLQRTLAALGLTVWRIDWERRWVDFHPLSAPPLGMADTTAQQGIAVDALLALLHPDDRAAVEQSANAARHGSGPIDLIARYRMQDGRWAPLLTRRIGEFGADGRPLALLGLSMDVEQLVAERQALLQQRERLAEVADVAGLGLWYRTGDPGSAEWNDAMFRLYGRQREQGPPTLAQWYEEIVHPLDVDRFRADQERCESQWLPVFDTEFRVRTADGRPRWVYAWSRRGERDGQRYAFGMHIDVTARRQANVELERERERALFAIEAAGVGVWRRKLDHSGAVWNDTMYRLRGLDPADPRPIEVLTLLTVHPDDRAMINELIHRRLAKGQPYEREYRVLWPDGSVHWLATRGRLVEDEDGRWMTGVNVDVTQRREADNLRRERERLEQARLAQSSFLARVSHELRTPMNAVLGFAELLGFDRQEPLTPRQADRVQRIEVAGRHLLALIDDVLDLARIEADPQPLQRSVVNLDDVARQAVAWVAAQAQEAAITLRIADAPLAGAVLADRRRLDQVLVNLLTNAIKYNRRGGEVEVGSARDGDRCALVVRDTGRGMTSEQCERAFEPFDRLGLQDEGIEGTGIGLTIVRQLVQRMGGEVRVTSTPGVGSEFSVWLADARSTPAAPEDAPAPAPAPAATALQPLLRVLCIDDHAVNLQLVHDLLALRPGTVFEGAATGRAGVAAATARPPDVVLLDLQLPDLHGTEVLKQLRTLPALARCRIIALSANAMPADVSAALALGFDDYWTKPIDARRFLAGIDALRQA